ncbi:MAG TPA: glycosyltransferase [Candidatus Limnocylindria bacterium]|nr:glycosyltransferase [Candidatus Limnocylindria bacterium]
MSDLNVAGSGDLRTVLHVVGNLDRGGAQEVVATLARELPAHGWRAVVVTLRDGPLRAEIEARGGIVEVVAGRRHSILSPLAAARELRRIRRDLGALVHQHRALVVQTHLLAGLDFLVLSLRSRRGQPAVLWTVHNARLELRPDQLPTGQRALLAPKRVAYRGAYRLGGRAVDAFVAVSDEVAASVRTAYRPPRRRLATIPNGVDVDRYGYEVDRAAVRRSLGLPAESRLVIVVAKLFRQKGHDVLLAALRSRPLPDDIGVLFAGEGPERRALEASISAMGLDGRVLLLGERPDVADLLAASDLFVLPSLWEGLPMALLEAMASGLPVVATDVAGSRQVVVDGESGRLVPPADPEALRTAIDELLANPVLLSTMGRAARQRVVASFSSATQAAQHAALYAQCLAQRGDPRA